MCSCPIHLDSWLIQCHTNQFLMVLPACPYSNWSFLIVPASLLSGICMSTKKSNIYQRSCFLPPSPSAAPRDTILIEFCVNSSWQKNLKSLLRQIWHHCDTHILSFFCKLFPPGNAHQRNWAAEGVPGGRHPSLAEDSVSLWVGCKEGQVWSYGLSLALPLVVPGRGPVVPVSLCGLAKRHLSK